MTKIRYFDDPTEIEVMPVKRQQSNRTHTIGLLLAAATVILSIEISIHRLIFSGLVLLTAIALAKPFAKQSIAFPKQSNAVLTKVDTLQRKLGIKLYGLAFTLLGTIFLLDLTTPPAQAQFLNDELKLPARSERFRIRELTKQGIRKTKFLRLYCTYTVAGAEETKTTDFVEKLMLQGQKTWHQFTGQIHQVRFHRIETLLKDSFHSGFMLWEQTLSNKMGLQIRPLSSAKILQFPYH